MRMRGNRKGEAFVVMLAIMLAGGLVLWLATGRFHMMPGHGGTKGMHKEDSSTSVGDPKNGPDVPPPQVEDDDPEPGAGPGSRRDGGEPPVLAATMVRERYAWDPVLELGPEGAAHEAMPAEDPFDRPGTMDSQGVGAGY